ncbi:HAD-IA family hydrolase [Bacillus mexicanus]|uniref:HAD family hydrolase n=1 Tax=Bacillus mexicanus TaxID=2834415 RepID=UPI003D1D6260
MKAIIFDFDGLIMDTESVWFDAFYKVAKESFDIKINIKEFALAVGTSEDSYLDLIEKQLGREMNRTEFSSKAKEKFDEQILNIKPRDGVVDYLEYAKEKNLKIGLATSSTYDWVEYYLKKFNIFHFFDSIKTSDIVGTKKPDPTVYIESLKSLGVLSNEVVAFEDSLNGFTAATKANIKTIVVPNALTKYADFPLGTHIIYSMGNISPEDLLSSLTL